MAPRARRASSDDLRETMLANFWMKPGEDKENGGKGLVRARGIGENKQKDEAG